jgi:hypothetical protein
MTAVITKTPSPDKDPGLAAIAWASARECH